MASWMASGFIFFHALLALQCFHVADPREIRDENLNNRDIHGHNQVHIMQHNMDLMNPHVHIFFKLDDLKVGNKIPFYFSTKDLSTSPSLLSNEEVGSIPFASSQLPNLLQFFSFSTDSPQAKAMSDTLHHCESPAIKGETKFCATSLESLLDTIRLIFGSNTPFKALSTNHITKPTISLQNYTIVEIPKEIIASRIVGCHLLPYPYAVFYCHKQESGNRPFKVLLRGENGGKVDAVAICHMDTSQWNHDHAAFLVLNVKPGSSPVCHVFPADNLLWIPSSAAII